MVTDILIFYCVMSLQSSFLFLELVDGAGVDSLVLTRVVSQVETSVVALGEALEMVAEQTVDRFAEVDREAKLVAGAVHTLSSILGTPIELDDRFEAPTLWGTAAFIADEMLRLSKDFLSVELGFSPMKAEFDWIKASMKDAHSSAEESGGNMRQILTFVMKRIHEIGPEVEAVKTRLGSVEQDIARGGKEPKRRRAEGLFGNQNVQGKVTRTSMDDLLRMLDGNLLGQSTGSSNPGGRTDIPTGPNQNVSDFDDSNESDDGTSAVLQQLVAEMLKTQYVLSERRDALGF